MVGLAFAFIGVGVISLIYRLDAYANYCNKLKESTALGVDLADNRKSRKSDKTIEQDEPDSFVEL